MTTHRTPMGPHRREWERLKREHDRIMVEIHQNAIDVASWNENNPADEHIEFYPEPELLRMPPMPPWEE